MACETVDADFIDLHPRNADKLVPYLDINVIWQLLNIVSDIKILLSLILVLFLNLLVKECAGNKFRLNNVVWLESF